MRRRVITGAVWTAVLLGVASLGDGLLLRIGVALCFMVCWFEVHTPDTPLRTNLAGRKREYWIQGELQSGCLAMAAALLILVPIGVREILALAVAAFSCDTGAYLIGKAVGKTSMLDYARALLRRGAPNALVHLALAMHRTSSTKTLEGYVGGLTVSFVATGIFGWLAMGFSPIVPTVGLWLCGGAVACLGDLLGSAAKRWRGFKDSGQGLSVVPGLGVLEKAMAGHGGFLDRFDSLCLVVIFYYLLQAFTPDVWPSSALFALACIAGVYVILRVMRSRTWRGNP